MQEPATAPAAVCSSGPARVPRLTAVPCQRGAAEGKIACNHGNWAAAPLWVKLLPWLAAAADVVENAVHLYLLPPCDEMYSPSSTFDVFSGDRLVFASGCAARFKWALGLGLALSLAIAEFGHSFFVEVLEDMERKKTLRQQKKDE